MASSGSSNYHHGNLRSALIETGLALTRTGGPEALRLREVTRAVGVTPNAAYRHFANHRALLAAVSAEIQDRMAQAMRRHVQRSMSDSGSSDSIAKLRGVGLGYVHFALAEPGWFKLAFFPVAEVPRPDGRIPPPLDLLRQALDDVAREYRLSPERRATAEWSCWSSVHGFAELAIGGPLRDHGPSALGSLAASVVDDVIAGVLHSGEGIPAPHAEEDR